MLDTLPRRHPHRRVLAGLRRKGLDDGGLADARFAGEEQHLALPLARLRPYRVQAREHGLAPDQGPDSRRELVRERGSQRDGRGGGELAVSGGPAWVTGARKR